MYMYVVWCTKVLSTRASQLTELLFSAGLGQTTTGGLGGLGVGLGGGGLGTTGLGLGQNKTGLGTGGLGGGLGMGVTVGIGGK